MRRQLITAGGGIDLSLVDNAGNVRTDGRTTANCYMVHANGTYCFPLVYGNAIKNGATNTSSYSYYKNYNRNLVNHLDENITNPWIKNNGITVNGVELLWQNGHTITEVKLVNDYISFKVENYAEGNAVISAKSGGTIVWSWHIWFTDRTFANNTLTTIDTGNSMIYQLAPCYVGFADKGWDYASNYPMCTLYMWGIPIAEPNFTSFWRDVCDIDGNVLTRDQYPVVQGGNSVSMGTILSNPFIYYNKGNGSQYCISSYNWNMNDNYTNADDFSVKTIKTVYDPCPPDFCVPTSRLFYYMCGGFDNPSTTSKQSGTGTNVSRFYLTWTEHTPNIKFWQIERNATEIEFSTGYSAYARVHAATKCIGTLGVTSWAALNAAPSSATYSNWRFAACGGAYGLAVLPVKED